MTHAVQFYSSGVLDGGCGTAINHAVVAVGYGVEPSNGTPYFRLRTPVRGCGCEEGAAACRGVGGPGGRLQPGQWDQPWLQPLQAPAESSEHSFIEAVHPIYKMS